MKNIAILAVILLSLFVAACSNAHGLSDARAQRDFANWRAEYLARAAGQGISVDTIAHAKPFLTFNEKIIRLDQKQPEVTQTFAQYLAATVTPARITRAREEYVNNAPLLHRLEQQYGVPGQVIIALWAKESDFGRIQGNYNILSSLATLAYDGRRQEFFESELTNALRMVDHGIAPDDLTGSWAGAMGQCQFMPSSYLKYAVDGDGDGQADIWSSTPDTLASIANYLHQNGWNAGLPVATQATIPQDFNPEWIQKKLELPASDWQSRGVVQPSGLDPNLMGATTTVVQPDGAGSQAYLAYDNYRVLMRWNRSSYFVLSVATLAGQINP